MMLALALAMPGGSGSGGTPFEPDATVALDFTTNRYRVGAGGASSPDFSALPGLTVSRATPSVAYAETSAGVLVQFASNVARITDKGLLVEEARTNLCLFSQAFGGGNWSVTSVADTNNAGAAPDGSNTANLVQATAGASNFRFTSAPSAIYTLGTTYTVSAYLKMGTHRFVEMRPTASATSNLTFAVYDLQLGTVNNSGGVVSTSLQALANGWFRAVLTFNPTASATATAAVLGFSFSGAGFDAPSVATGSETFYAWGVQAEAGAFPTSYIPTTTVAVTRAADAVTLTLATQASPITLLASAQSDMVSNAVRRVLAQLNDGTTANRLFLAREATNDAALTYVAATVFQSGATDGATRTGALDLRMAAAVANGVAARAGINGTAYAAGGAGTFPTGLNQIILGAQVGASGYWNGYIRKAVVYPTAYTDAALQALTS